MEEVLFLVLKIVINYGEVNEYSLKPLKML